MSEIYANEPVTHGKVILHTTMGPLDVELWSRETPRTCRSFLQLCLEGYYDNTIFHRLIPGFLLQGGDPTGTGEGGLSIYDDPKQLGLHAGGRQDLKPCEGPPLTLELNSRLRFRYRGLMGAASKIAEAAADSGGGKGAPKKGGAGGAPAHIGSQFFFTLGSAEALNGKHTLFGKVTGASLFNLLRIGELPIDKYDRPRDPPKITKTEVVFNPFNDIVPRCLPPAEEEQEGEGEESEEEQQQRPQLATAKSNLLSFTEEDEDMQQVLQPQQQQQPKASFSAHDLLQDPKLSKEASSAALWQQQQQQQAAADRLKARVASLAAARGSAAAAAAELPDQSSTSSSSSSGSEGESDSDSEHSSRRRRSRSRSRSFERERGGPVRRGAPQVLGKKDFAAAVAAQPDADLLSPAEQRRRLLLLQRKTKSTRDRQRETLEKLSAFKQQLRMQQKNSSSSSSRSGTKGPEKEAAAGKRDKAAEAARAAAARATERVIPALPEGGSESDEEGGPSEGPWFQTGGLRFAIDSSTAYQMDAARAELEIRDPLKNKNAAADPKVQMRKMPHAHEGKPRELARW